MTTDPRRNRPWLLLAAASGMFGIVSLACARWSKDAAAERTDTHPVTAASSKALADLAASGGQTLANVAEAAMPAVVSVASTRVAKLDTHDLPFDSPFFRHFFSGPNGPSPFGGQERERVQHGLGSGVVVGKDVILTNAHVVEGATELEVTTYDRKLLKAKLAGSDPESDLAVLRISDPPGNLKSLEFADSSHTRLGQLVLAIGNPFGVGQTVTMGIISAKGRADLGIEPYEDFIQTDAAINPGNSGGALVDLDGRLIGVPTAILSPTGGNMGVGFAIPSNMARPVMTSLIEHGKVDRGSLGVVIQNLDATLARSLGLKTTDGVLIADVTAGSPAARAGIQRGDVILSVNGQKVDSTGMLRNAIASNPVGARVKLELSRAGRVMSVEATLGQSPRSTSAQAPDRQQGEPKERAAGLSLAAPDVELRRRLGVPSSIQGGVVVENVVPGSPASEAGVRPGDLLLELDREPVKTPEDVARAWKRAKGAVSALIFRQGQTLFVAIEH